MSKDAKNVSTPPERTKVFISHSSQDDDFVRMLRERLNELGQDGWIDSRELRGGNPLWSEIQQAIEATSAYAVVVSPEALQSKWVGKELTHALKLRNERGKEKFPVIPISLNGTKLGVLEEFFGEEPIYIPVSSDAGGIAAAMNAILVALGKRLPADAPTTPQPKAEPLEELVLELTDLKFLEQDGVKRASARARLVYEPATPGQSDVHSERAWRFVAPIGPIEGADLAWYLEKYAVWPACVPVIQERARKVEANLVMWGQLLHNAALPLEHVATVKEAWAKISDRAGRRFSVHVDTALEAGAPADQLKMAKEVATLLLGLPWELLHDGTRYLFQGAKPARVRRRLPFTERRDVPVAAPPIRILLVTARPEDDACGYIDHRVSALPLVEAMETLPDLVKIHVLSPPTLPALSAELQRARDAYEPYHVVHFDGHGVYNRTVGLGGLCFEHPDDIGKLDNRRHITVFTSELGPLLRDHRIPLVFLEACQTAQAEKASESVASELLKAGVASVVAMSHCVLVETARRFVEVFYQALAAGKRVGDAMLVGQRRLKEDTSRGRIFGADELRLEDWFVPVLFQEKDDPQLFTKTPARQTVEDFKTALAARLGEMPAVPQTGFIGRSRELLALQRLLRHERWAVVRGQGGEGKTTLTAEFARWMVRSQQMRRAAFVSVEGLERNIAQSVLDKLGGQLVKPSFSTQADCHGDIGKAEQEIVRVLRERPTLLVIDNMESILLPPLLAETTPEALSAEAREELKTLLALSERLLKAGETRVIFTSREQLPTPFDAGRHRWELHQLDKEDAVKLVERALNAEGSEGGASDATREQIEALVDAVHCHARTLALLTLALRAKGVEETHKSLIELMAEMERKFPGKREQSLFASVELSLRRMLPANRDRVRVLGVFQGGFKTEVLGRMMQWKEEDVVPLARELVSTGLATANRYAHLTLNPALCPYLRERLESPERDTLTARWVEEMRAYASFLYQQQSQNSEMAATLTMLELPNLFALLELVQRAGHPEATIGLASSLYSLLQSLGKPRLLGRVGQVRDAAAKQLEKTLGDVWSHARFEATRTRIQQQLGSGSLREGFDGARLLLEQARVAGRQAYVGADYDLAMACWLLARVLRMGGGAEKALPLLHESRQGFETIANEQANKPAERMAYVCVAEIGDCLLHLGRLDEAAAAYEGSINGAEQLNDVRQVAVGKAQLGTVRMQQRRYPEALSAYAEAGERFTQLGEPGTVAVTWHQTGMVYQRAGQPEAAEDAYRKSLAITVRLGNVAGQAGTLVQLGILYGESLNRPEETVDFFRQAADKFVENGDMINEGLARNNLANALQKLRRFDDARRELRRAIECKEPLGHAGGIWYSWNILTEIENAAGNRTAAGEAKRQAIASYLAYRRDGGENHDLDGRIALAVAQALRAGKAPEAISRLQQLAADPDTAWLAPFTRALQAIVAGSRDHTLADALDLNYRMAAEILFLIETQKRPNSLRFYLSVNKPVSGNRRAVGSPACFKMIDS
jgi:tetratricopeptide (TPR) repeat protein